MIKQSSLFQNTQPTSPTSKPSKNLKVAGLFAGIGGLEYGLHQAGHSTVLLCEIEESARQVLHTHFPEVRLHDDVRTLKSLGGAELVAAGFPCQDLSQAGRTAGIKGKNSGLVGEVFRLIGLRKRQPRWLLLENVPFMLQLQRGKAMSFLIDFLEEHGFSWAYRTVDTRAFGLPQRRQRVLLLASRTEDPREILFPDDVGEPPAVEPEGRACGFYWTEGLKGLGWAVDAVPPLKGGSTIGIPSPPAIWRGKGHSEILTPDIRDAERLQGFPANWTESPETEQKRKKGVRWKLVGNAVSVPVAKWVGLSLATPRWYDDCEDEQLRKKGIRWPKAAWGKEGDVFRANVTEWPVRWDSLHLDEFLEYPLQRLSARAATGFLKRARASSLRFPEGLLQAVEQHIEECNQPM